MSDCEDYDKLTHDQQVQVILKMNENFRYTNFALAGLLATTILAGLAIVFVWRKQY